MSLKHVLAIAGALLCAGDAEASSEGWLQLKAGMNRVETASALGAPLFKNLGRGFELWIYDGGAEVVCFQGAVVAWTPPAGIPGVEGRQVDVRPFFRRGEQQSSAATSAVSPAVPLKLLPAREMRLPKL